ncbi:MAG TPA: HAMP domain-containing sensor histidine kinase [Motilibacteraceae bacterium]|nr:HAMP domain-containing sensor histidine kinase [Motilibacteraceae bacterium]
MRLPHHDRRWSLRSRLVLATTAVVAVSVLAVVGVALLVLRGNLVRSLDDRLRQQATAIVTALPDVDDRTGGAGALLGRYGSPGEEVRWVRLVHSDGTSETRPDVVVQLPVSPAARQVAREGGSVVGTEGPDDHQLRVLTLGAGNGTAVQIAAELDAVDEQLGGLAAAFALVAGGAVLLAVGLAWSLAGSVLAPVGRLTAAAERIGRTGDLDVRLEETRRSDELGRLADRFNAMLDTLEESVLAQRQLVADASHELRTPLASVRANVELLREVDRLDPAERDEVVAAVVGQVDELTGLVSDLVELARGDEPVTSVDEVRLDRLVEAAVRRAQRHWPAVAFGCRTEPAVVVGSAQRLDRAVANVLDNAGKFTPAGGHVQVSLTVDGCLRVVDDGPGVPEDFLPHVFDRFHRADSARGLPGSGLGLAIVKQAVEAHGGNVAVQNRKGGGAEVVLRLPAEPASEPSPIGSVG